MRRGSFRLFGFIALTACAAAALVASTGTNAAAPTPAAFRVADGSVACAALRSGAVACRSVTVSRAIILQRNGRSYASALSLAWTDSTRVLHPAESWWHGSTVCRVVRSARVRCSVAGGAIVVDGRRIAGVL